MNPIKAFMSLASLAAVSVHSVTINHGQVAKGPSPAAAPAAVPAAAPIGMCGCTLPAADQCSCGASLDYLKCVTGKCDTGECNACADGYFEEQCTGLSTTCAAELEFVCGSTTTCEGKFHQDDHNVIGLTLDTDHLADDAYCGPWGKCLGTLHIAAAFHRAPVGTWLSCLVDDAAAKSSACTVEIKGPSAMCTMPMVEKLAVDAQVKGRCWITNGEDGEKISKNAWFTLTNDHPKTKGATVRPQASATPATTKGASKGNATMSSTAMFFAILFILFVLFVAIAACCMAHFRKSA